MTTPQNQEADICMILEGTYPYVPGGVSDWVHDLISTLPELKFHLLAIVASEENLDLRYTLPENVMSLSHVVIQKLPEGCTRIPRSKQFFKNLETPLNHFHSNGNLSDFAKILEVLKPYESELGSFLLLDSSDAWELVVQMYKTQYPGGSFLDYFWCWRYIMGGFYSILLAHLPPARIYHAVSTGYAGLLATKAKLETQRPVFLTEQEIFTNERRIEISMSDEFHQNPPGWLNLKNMNKDLNDLWIDTMINYSRLCYKASDRVITLCTENQKMQIADGADPKKLDIIPNGVDYQFYSNIPRKKTSRPTIALIGSVAPIKDVKSFILACDILKKQFPDLLAYVMGPTDEDKSYFQECQGMVRFLGLQETISFTEPAHLADYLDRIQINVLTSISEGQPLAILELAAIGIPSVATNVGGCGELIMGSEFEFPKLKPGGALTPLSNPGATAKEIAELLTDKNWYDQCSQASKDRISKYYNKPDLIKRYRDLYQNNLSDHKTPQTTEV